MKNLKANLRPKTTQGLLILSCIAATFYLTSGARATNIVVDGGFEMSPAPNFSSAWTLNEPNGFSNVGADGPIFQFSRSGTQYANLSADFGQIGSLSQTLNTVAGSIYSLSFYLANDVQSANSSFAVFFNNVSLSFTTTALFGTSGNYTEFTFSNLIATNAFTTLEFQYRQDDDFWRLDDISVNSAAGVPEGGSALAFLSVGLAAVEGLRRKFANAS